METFLCLVDSKKLHRFIKNRLSLTKFWWEFQKVLTRK